MNKPKWLDVSVDRDQIWVSVNNGTRRNLRDKTRIRQSIQKFQYLLELATLYPDRDIYWDGAATCPLCWKYNNIFINYEDRCIGCPIMTKTGRRYCMSTPYTRMNKIKKAGKLQSLIGLEIEFLESLL